MLIGFHTLARILRTAPPGAIERKSASTLWWNASGRCCDPFTLTSVYRPPEKGDVRRVLGAVDKTYSGGDHPIFLDVDLPCRKCVECLKAKAKLWASRAVTEIQAAHRTWFITLTLSSHEHFRVESECRMADDSNGQLFEQRSSADQFAKRCDVVGRDIQKWLKRLRKARPRSLRYLVVAESHKTGLPHWHMLLHETDPAQPVTKREIQSQWTLGFSQAKLVETTGTAWYVCKYLTKHGATRVRSSQHYGSSNLDS